MTKASLRTRAFHGNARRLKTQPGEEFNGSITASAKNPGAVGVGRQRMRYERAPNPLLPVFWCDDQHGKVAVGYSIRDGPHEPDNAAR
jgi:hypothetical protein